MLSLYIFYNIFDSLIFCVDLTESAGTKDRIGSSVRPGPDQQQPIRAEQRRPRDGQKDQEFKEGEENNVVFPFVGGQIQWRVCVFQKLKAIEELKEQQASGKVLQKNQVSFNVLFVFSHHSIVLKISHQLSYMWYGSKLSSAAEEEKKKELNFIQGDILRTKGDIYFSHIFPPTLINTVSPAAGEGPEGGAAAEGTAGAADLTAGATAVALGHAIIP